MSAPLLFSPQDNPYTWIGQAVHQITQRELEKVDFSRSKLPSKEVQNTLIQKIKKEVKARIKENPAIQTKLEEMPYPTSNLENLYTSEILSEIEKYFSKNKK